MEIEAKMGDPRALWSPTERHVAGRLELVERLMEFRDPNKQLPEFSRLISEGNYVIISSNHSQHANIAGLYGVVRRLDHKPALGWDLVIADSLVEGDQGKSLQDFALGMKPYLAQERIEMKPVLRDKDVKEYYGEGKKSAMELTKAKARSAETGRQLAESARFEDRGLLVFPRGTIEEARKRPDGRRMGMRQVKSSLIPALLRRAVREGRGIAVLPLGMSRTYRIVEPDRAFPSFPSLVSIGMMRVSEYLGINIPDLHTSDVNVGNILKLEDFEKAGLNCMDKADDDNVIDLVMRASAQLIPYKDRGYYDGRTIHA